MNDFWSSDAGRHASIAKQYLEGALTLSEAQLSKGRILFLPTLALAGHGLEVMLKAGILLNGGKPPKSGPAGHDISGLWRRDECEPVRGHLFASASIVAMEGRDEHLFSGVPYEAEVLPLIEEYVGELGLLHGGQGYPLRYPTDRDRLAPRTPFLVRSLWRVADDFVKRPRDFELVRFRGLA